MTGLVEFLTARLDRDERTTTTGQCRCGSGPARPGCPDRVLADVVAKRKIIERARFVGDHGPAVDDVRALDMTTGASAALRDVLRLLALPYADHPDYDPTWRP